MRFICIDIHICIEVVLMTLETCRFNAVLDTDDIANRAKAKTKTNQYWPNMN